MAATNLPWNPEIWTGEWRWVAETANFADPLSQNKAQMMTVDVRGTYMVMETLVTFSDKSTRTWIWEGQFDGKLYPIRWKDDHVVLQDMAFVLLRDGIGTDASISPDGRKRGSEYFVLTKNKLEVWGCNTRDGEQYPYFEEWDRVA